MNASKSDGFVSFIVFKYEVYTLKKAVGGGTIRLFLNFQIVCLKIAKIKYRGRSNLPSNVPFQYFSLKNSESGWYVNPITLLIPRNKLSVIGQLRKR
jgi:hypothetical protein